MEIIATAVSKESRQARGQTYWGVKHSDGQWYNVITDNRPAQGTRYNVEVKTSESNGRTYRWATMAKAAATAPSAANGNGGSISWEDYERAAELAHGLALNLEPDISDLRENGEHVIVADRAQARLSFTSTALIAFSNGRLALPKDEPPEAPDDSDIPF